MKRSKPFALCLLAFCLAVLSAEPALTQTLASQATPDATAPTAAPVAYVYVGTAKGVNLYDAASNGTLTLVSGSPFKTAGTAAGSNQKYFITLGTHYLHSYPVTPNGAIKGQVSQINTQDYGDCGSASDANLDHTGQNVYVLINPSFSSGPCAAYQSFSIAKASGALTFQGVAVANTDYSPLYPLTITGNNKFAYAPNPDGGMGDVNAVTYKVFLRKSDGALENWNSINGLVLQHGPDNYTYFPWVLTADPTNHLAVALGTIVNYLSPIVSVGPTQLVSYTVDSAGNISTTNTGDEVPTPDVGPTLMNMSPSGKLLAVAGNTTNCCPLSIKLGTNGLQVFHFNGANPITPYSKTLTTAPIDRIHWDNNNHLYALSNSTNKLYVYTVTPTTIAAAPGSPYTITGPNGLVVVPISCSAPTSPGVPICFPASGSTVRSPVLIEATSTVTGTIARMEVWVDGVKKYTATATKILNTSISVAAGKHHFVVFAVNAAGQKWENAVYSTVQ